MCPRARHINPTLIAPEACNL